MTLAEWDRLVPWAALYEVEHAAGQLGVHPRDAAMLILGLGLATGEAQGLFTRPPVADRPGGLEWASYDNGRVQ